MNWTTITPTVETIKAQHLRRMETGGPAAVASADQDIMFFKNLLTNIGFNWDTVTDDELWFVLVATVTTWWVATRSADNGSIDENEYASAVAAASTAAWGIISVARPHWLTEHGRMPS